MSSDIELKVAALEFERSQVVNHPLAEFRARAAQIDAEIAEWLSGDAPAEVPPSEKPDPDPEPDPEPVPDAKPGKADPAS